MDLSDKRIGMVPCPDCGQEHALSFDNLLCLEDDELNHPVYKTKRPETAYYVCPHCGSMWDDDIKNNAVKCGRWVATAPFRGIAGFYLNELYSPFPGSRMAVLMEKWLTAKHDADLGDTGSIIAFTNSSIGIPYEYKGDAPAAENLQERALDYEPGTVPAGGLILTAGVDIQHDRIEVIIRAWGRGEESWLVYYDRLYGNTLLIEDAVWSELDKVLFASYPNELGFNLRLSAVSIDSSDGTTSDAVYKYVRSRQGRGIAHVMAIKGVGSLDKVIFSRPGQVMQTNASNTKAAKYGVAVFNVGVSKAKDLLIGEGGRITLSGTGPGRMHVYQSVSPEYFEQLLAEVKAPLRTSKGHAVKVWQKKTGKRNEVLDCEVYALHASRATKVDLMNNSRWDSLEATLRQSNLFDSPADVPTAEVAVKTKQAPKMRTSNFATGWKK
jgi:phage terminase large subunit GpA-like protein